MCTIMRNHFPWRRCLAKLLRGSAFMSVLMMASEAKPGARPLPRSPASRQGSENPVPYLPVIGPPPLRFSPAPPQPDLSTRPAAFAPPMPSIGEEIAAANTASAKSVGPRPVGNGFGLGQGPPIPASAAPAGTNPAGNAPQQTEPQALLPDDTESETQQDEILPYFQFPGSGGATIVVPPGSVSNQPTRLPVSTAVYREH